jgi:hypothetical protein
VLLPGDISSDSGGAPAALRFVCVDGWWRRCVIVAVALEAAAVGLEAALGCTDRE